VEEEIIVYIITAIAFAFGFYRGITSRFKKGKKLASKRKKKEDE